MSAPSLLPAFSKLLRRLKEAAQVDLNWDGAATAGQPLTACSDLRFEDIHMSGGPSAGVFLGTPAAPIMRVVLKNVSLGSSASTFANCSHVLGG